MDDRFAVDSGRSKLNSLSLAGKRLNCSRSAGPVALLKAAARSGDDRPFAMGGKLPICANIEAS